jgi:hypothetical protein
MAEAAVDTPAREDPIARWDAEHRHEAWWADWVRLRDLLEAGRGDLARELSGELATKWPDVEVIQHYARVLEPAVARSVPDAERGRSLEKDHLWLREHAHEYPGCWLAVYEGRLITADPDFTAVADAAERELGKENVFLFFQPSKPA